MSAMLTCLSRLSPRLLGRSLGGGSSRWLGTTAPALDKVEPENILPDPLELERDVVDPLYAEIAELQLQERENSRREYKPLMREVDLETEFDRDDVEAVSPEDLYCVRPPLEPLGRPVDIDAELDLSPSSSSG